MIFWEVSGKAYSLIFKINKCGGCGENGDFVLFGQGRTFETKLIFKARAATFKILVDF